MQTLIESMVSPAPSAHHPIVQLHSDEELIDNPFLGQLFSSDNFYPVEAGGYSNFMLNYGAGYLMTILLNIPAMIGALPALTAYLGWEIAGGIFAGVFEDFSQTGLKLIIDYGVLAVEWIPLSIFIYTLRAIEYGIWELILLLVPEEDKTRVEDTDIGTGK